MAGTMDSPATDRCSTGFMRLIEPFPLSAIERYAGTAYGLWLDWRLAYINPGWIGFAAENGGPPALQSPDCLHTPVMDVTAEVLRPFYRELFTHAIERRNRTRRPLAHRYECSSARAFREYVMHLYPLGQAEGLLVVNSLVVERPHAADAPPAGDAQPSDYLDEHGLMHQCAHCRRMQNLRVPGRWDWVPAWVETIPPEASHTLCYFCLHLFYPKPKKSPDR